MTAAATPPLQGWTDRQLESLPHIGKVELIDGKVIMSPAGFDHGFVAGIILSRLMVFVLDRDLGAVVDSSTGFRLQNENLLSPDVSFVSAARLRNVAQPLRKFFSGSPDLAVEVLSPGDSRAEAEQKLKDYFLNDTLLAWLVDPMRKTVSIHRRDGTSQELTGADSLSGENVIPGFSLKISDIFRSYSSH